MIDTTKLSETEVAILGALQVSGGNVPEIRKRVQAASPSWRVRLAIAFGGLYVETRELARRGLIERREIVGGAERGFRPAYFYTLKDDKSVGEPRTDGEYAIGAKTVRVASIAFKLLHQIPNGTPKHEVVSILTTTVLEGLRVLGIEVTDFAARLCEIAAAARAAGTYDRAKPDDAPRGSST